MHLIGMVNTIILLFALCGICSIISLIAIDTKLEEFNPSLTLVPGQSFNWQQLDNESIWVGVVNEHPLAISKDYRGTRVACLTNDMNMNDLATLLHRYLQLDVNLSELYTMVCM